MDLSGCASVMELNINVIIKEGFLLTVGEDHDEGL
jgi:hypothetical protein